MKHPGKIFYAFSILFLSLCFFLSAEDRQSAGSVSDTDSLDWYQGKTIGFVYNYGSDVDIMPRFPDNELKYFNTEGDLIAALTSGKVDAVCIDELIALRMAARNNRLRVSSADLGKRSIGFIFKKGRTDSLKEGINSILVKYMNDGTLERITQKWLSSNDSQKTMPDQDWDTSNGTIRFGGEFTSDPVAYIKDGEYAGLDLELMYAIARELKMSVQVVDTPFDALIPAVTSGKIDLAGSAITWTEERSKSVDFSELYLDNSNVFLVLKDKSELAADGSSFFTRLSESFRKNFVLESRWKMIVSGIKVTLLLSLFSGIFGLLLGFGLCMIRRMNRKASTATCKGFVSIIQGTPVVVLLMVLYYIVFGSIDISGMVVAVIGFSLNFGAYTSEIMRSGLESIDIGQTEAALALGYNRFQTFWKIVFPQAAVRFIPVLKGEFISMVKMTSVVGYIAVQDLTKTGDIIRSRTMEAFFPLIVTAILYFAIAWLFTSLLGLIEKEINPKRRRR